MVGFTLRVGSRASGQRHSGAGGQLEVSALLAHPPGPLHRRAASVSATGVLAACDPSIVERAVLAATSMVQDVSRLYPYVRDEMRTHICGSSTMVAALPL